MWVVFKATRAAQHVEAESEVRVEQVTDEIVDHVGQWEKIVDAPVPLRSLDAELGDRFFRSWSRLLMCSRCFQSRSPVNSRG